MISLKSIETSLCDSIGIGKLYPLQVDILAIAANVEAVMDNQVKADFSIHVIPLSDSGNETGSTCVNISRVEAVIGILIGVKDLGDAIGSDVQDPLKEYREAVASVLQGLTPSGATRPMSFADGALVRYKDNIYWQLDEYTVGYNIREIV